MNNSFDGVIDEIPLISVDNFSDHNKKAYFLSHCHSDHSFGLYTTEFMNKLKHTPSNIYMSALSAEIVKQESKKYGGRNEILVNYIVPLDLGKKEILNLDENGEDKMEVTLIPVDHCLGSVMFLFEKDNKNILFTGDFRITDICNIQQYFHVNGKRITIHKLYVDTTFQDPQYKHFPKISESVNCAVVEIKRWLDTKKNGRILLQTSGKYTSEVIFNEIYNRLKVKVYVQDEELWRVYSYSLNQEIYVQERSDGTTPTVNVTYATTNYRVRASRQDGCRQSSFMLESLVPGVTDNETETRITLCENKKGQVECHENYSNKDPQSLYIHFSAKKWKNYQQNSSVLIRRSYNRLKVLFATHCSSSELNNFIKFLEPQEVVGFPEPYTARVSLMDQSD